MSDAKAIRPKPSVIGLRSLRDVASPTPRAVTNGTVTVDVAANDTDVDGDAMTEHGIGPIDLLIVNLYPFEATIARDDCTRADAIENIDIGGPAMVRSAAKNFESVAVVTSPDQYEMVLEKLESGDGRSPQRGLPCHPTGHGSRGSTSG